LVKEFFWPVPAILFVFRHYPPSVRRIATQLAEVERTMIVAAYQKSSRKPLEAARLLGIGKTTFYRKLREIKQIAA
jgi:transcriptional regulator of acetoin/glycerol metabolism